VLGYYSLNSTPWSEKKGKKERKERRKEGKKERRKEGKKERIFLQLYRRHAFKY
jgi:hypothetical protein